MTLVVAYFSFGTAMEAGQAAGSTLGAANTVTMVDGTLFVGQGLSTSGAVIAGATTAGITALAGQAAVALINNQFDIGAALNDLGSSASVKNLLTAIVTGGVLQGLNLNPTGLPTVGAGGQQFMTQLGQNLTAGVARAVIGTAINGGSLEEALKDGLKNALLDTAAAQGANWIGRNTELGSFTNYAAHAIAGCAVGAARSGGNAEGGCAAGAIGATLGEAAAIFYNRDRSPEDILLTGIRPDTVEFASLLAGIGVAIAGGDAAEINLGSNAGANAAANNFRSAVVTASVKACVTNISCMALVGISTVAVADLPRRTEELMRENSSLTPKAAEALAISEMLTNALLNRPTTGSGSGYPVKPADPTVLPAPDRVAQEFGPPPLESPRALQGWLENVLEGVPLDQAQGWARDFITSLPAAQQQTLSDLIMLSIEQNSAAGKSREKQVTGELQRQYPGASVQNEQYLRDKDGNIAIDPVTGTGRRLDHVVIHDGKIIDVVETTSLTAKKEQQMRHEESTRNAGGVYVLNRDTGKLIEVPSSSRIVRRP